MEILLLLFFGASGGENVRSGEKVLRSKFFHWSVEFQPTGLELHKKIKRERVDSEAVDPLSFLNTIIYESPK